MIVDKSEVIVDISKTQLESLDSWEIQSAVPWGIVLGDGMQHDAIQASRPRPFEDTHGIQTCR